MPSPANNFLPLPFPGGCVRRMSALDLSAFQTYRATPGLGRYQGWSPMEDTEALAFLSSMEAQPLFPPGEWIQLGIAESSTDTLIGDIGLHLSDDGQSGEIGFTLAPSAQGRGIATAAVREALRLFFTITQAAEILGITDARNTPSIRLLERLGFILRETRDAIFRGEPCVEHIFSLPRPDAR